jgi:argininosuccinate synthase
MSKIVLAYSGGLDTSVLLKKFIVAGHDVIAVTLDLGESDMVAGAGSNAALEAVRKKAIDLGAVDAVLVDARERFIENYAFKALRANALYEGVYPLSAALSRPLIADLLVEVAEEKGADTVAHGCTGKGNDQVRIEIGVKARNRKLTVLCPLRDEPLSRPDAIAYAQKHGVPISQSVEKPYSVDANLWGRSIEAGILEDPWNAPPEDAYAWTVAPEKQPAKGDELVLDFEDGLPKMGTLKGAELVKELNVAAGAHGVGRLDIIEDRVVGLKSREVYECPGSLTLIAANKALERLVLTRDELRMKAILDQRYSELIYDGLWSSPLRDALDAFNLHIAQRMNGSIRVRLHRGAATIVGSRSPFGLYDEHLATYGAGDAFKHDAAAGFIDIWGLPVEVSARVRADALSTTRR